MFFLSVILITNVMLGVQCYDRALQFVTLCSYGSRPYKPG